MEQINKNEIEIYLLFDNKNIIKAKRKIKTAKEESKLFAHNNKNIIKARYETETVALSFINEITDDKKEIIINSIKDAKGVKTLAQLRTWILNNRKKLGIDIEIEEIPITTKANLLKIDDAKKIEGIEYYKDEKDNKLKIIAYYQEGGAIKGFVFPISEKLSRQEFINMVNMVEKEFNELKYWILDREYVDNITTIDQLMKLNKDAKISDFKYNPNNKKFYFKYKEGNEEKRGSLKLNKEIDNISDTLPDKTLTNKNIVELKKWILNNRKKLGIDIKIEEKPITTEDDLSSLGNKTIEGIEYYQKIKMIQMVQIQQKELSLLFIKNFPKTNKKKLIIWQKRQSH